MSTQLQSQTHAALPHVLVVDDDPTMRQLVSDYLGKNELRVTAVADGRSTREVLADMIVNLVILDLKLRGEDGMQIARRLRDDSAIPILMLTGRAEEADRVMGLELGADDYLTKPFSHAGAARAHPRHPAPARRRRAPGHARQHARLPLRRLGAEPRHAPAHAPAGEHVDPLTNGEFSLLVVLLGAPERVLSRDQLLDLSRLHNDEVYDRSIDVQIVSLRRKIEVDPADPRYIRTERGAGYVFGVPVETVY